MKSIRGIILYIDILGYKNLLLNNTEKDDTRIKYLLDQFIKVYRDLNFRLVFGEKFEKAKLLKRSFSDNFLFVYESSDQNFQDLLHMQTVASIIQSQFLYVGILTRGSITYGEIFYDDDIVYGRDLIKAVELENHEEPSVVIDEKFENLMKKNNCEYRKHNCIFFVHQHSLPDLNDVIDGVNKYLINLNKVQQNETILNKIEWVINQINEYFTTDEKFSLHMDDNKYFIEKKGRN